MTTDVQRNIISVERKKKEVRTTEQIRKDKVYEACEGMCRVFDELELTYKEREIVCKSGWETEAVAQMDEEIQKEIKEMLRKTTLEEKVMKVLPAIIASVAIIISLISLAMKFVT